MDSIFPKKKGLVPSAVNTLPINLAILDEDGEIQWTNSAWRKFGKQNDIEMRPDTIGVNYLDITASGNTEYSRRVYENLEALLSGEIGEFEHEYPCHSPEKFRWFLMRAASFSVDGHRYAAVAHIDITERRLRERELQTFKEAAEQSGHSVFITDSEGDIVYVNPMFEEITGHSREDVIGKTPRVLKSDAHDEDFYSELWETITAGEVWEREMVNERKNGEQYVVDQTIAPISDKDNTITHYVAVNQDITDRVTYEERLEEQRDNLEILNEVVRHDIRNDIQLIQAYAALLEDHVDEEGQTFLETIQESSAQAVDLTKTARDLADVMLQADADPSAVGIDQTIQNQVEEIRSAYPEAVITVENSLPKVRVRADEMLDAVFRNLIENAIQHNDKDVPEVVIRSAVTEKTAKVEIADNGPGIPDAQKENVFGKGEKGIGSEGTGLGLYLVQTLVERYQGTVRVEDNDPEGSVFVVELPLAEN